jgi:PTS system nitrogen regulatory IIA component
MNITIRQAATYLDVPEATVRRWIASEGLPAHRVNEQLHCNAIELWEWATAHGHPVSKALLLDARQAPEAVPPLTQLLTAGGIHRDLGGDSKAEVFREVVEALPLPADLDRDSLLSVLEAREAMGSTGIGDGIAIPHVRNPILLHVEHPFVALCMLKHPIDFDAVDGKPVGALFVVVSPNVPAHLQILARLGYTLRDAGLRALLREGAPSDEIMHRIRAIESATPVAGVVAQSRTAR